MKRYAIVYADGSNRRLTQIDYSSRKEAGDALIYFLTCNEDCDCYCTTYEEGDDVDAYGRKKPNMPTHWMKMPTHPQ